MRRTRVTRGVAAVMRIEHRLVVGELQYGTVGSGTASGVNTPGFCGLLYNLFRCIPEGGSRISLYDRCIAMYS